MPRRSGERGSRRPARTATAAVWLIGACGLLAFPQHPAIGSPAPMQIVHDVDGHEHPLAEFAGPRGIVILFWADWSSRSLEELERLHETQADLEQHGVKTVAVNVDHQVVDDAALKVIRERVASLETHVPIVVDEGLKLFGVYGVVTVPSTAVVNAKGELVYFSSGYSPAGREELFDAIRSLAGLDSARHAPSGPIVDRAASRRLQLGRSQLATRRVAAAKASFAAAAEADPAFVDPIVELAAIAIDERDLARARELLAKALAQDASHTAARRERARADFADGNAADAIAALEPLASGERGDPVSAAYLGFILLAGSKPDEARDAFERARQPGGDDPRAWLGSETTSDAVLEAMIAYRRASVLPRP